MTFSELIFSDNFNDFGKYKHRYIGSIMVPYDLPRIIMHEFGHSYAYFTNGESYPCFYYMWSENWAIWYMNTHYCEPNNIPTETYYWSPKKWFKYGKPTP